MLYHSPWLCLFRKFIKVCECQYILHFLVFLKIMFHLFILILFSDVMYLLLLMQLSVPECGRLTADGILWNLKVLKSAGKPRLKYLGVNGIFGMTHQHFEEFKVLLGVDSSKRPSTRKPRFLQGGQLSVSSDDDYTIDIEICPKCQQLRVVYDCPSESCLKKKSTAQLCRACTICIKRCINCGRCLNNCPYHELFNFDLLCIDCWQEFFEHQERQVPHKQTSCHFFFYG